MRSSNELLSPSGRRGNHFFPLVVCSTAAAMISIWGRMTMQRKWRQWLSKQLFDYWLGDGQSRRLIKSKESQTPEYQIAERRRLSALLIRMNFSCVIFPFCFSKSHVIYDLCTNNKFLKLNRSYTMSTATKSLDRLGESRLVLSEDWLSL